MKTKKSKYQDIATLEELETALRENRSRIQNKGVELSYSLDRVKSFYTPQNIARVSVQKYALDQGLYSMGLGAVRSLKKLIQ